MDYQWLFFRIKDKLEMVIPKYIKAVDWFASLATDYPNETIPIITKEKDWQKIATIIANTGEFKNNGVPLPGMIKKRESDELKWNEWAQIVYFIMMS